MIHLKRSILLDLIKNNMWKFIYKTEKGTGEVIINENDLMEAVIKYQDNFEFDILTVTREEASIL